MSSRVQTTYKNEGEGKAQKTTILFFDKHNNKTSWGKKIVIFFVTQKSDRLRDLQYIVYVEF